jgi:hypothetical protein
MKPDSFKLQLQAVLTTYYQDIKRVQGASGCHKTRIVKPRFKAQEDDTGNEGADAADAATGAGTAVLLGATPALALRAPAAVGRHLQLLYLPPALSGRRGHWVLRRRLLRLMLIKLVCLKIGVTPGSSQTLLPLHTGQPAGQIKNLQIKGYIRVHTTFNSVCTFNKLYIVTCTLNISCTYLDIHVCKQEIGNRHVCTWYVHGIYMFI